MLERLISPFRHFGLFAGLLYAIDRALARVSSALRLHFYEIMVQPISEQPLLPSRLRQQLRIRELKRGDPEIALMPARPDIKESRFRQNAICLGAFRGEEFVGYIWLCFREYEEDEVRCTFVLTPEHQAVFDFDLYVFPEYRMGLAFVGIWNEASAFLRTRGIRYTYSRLTRFNVASRRAHQHLGWKRAGHTIFFQAWGVELMVATLFPYLHVSLLKRHRVRLKLKPDALRARISP